MTEHAYKARIKGWIDAALSKKRLSLNELIWHLPGVNPDVVAQHVHGDKRIAEPTNVARSEEPLHALRFPVPHPLDYDWRFVESSRQLLLDRALALTDPRDPVVFLGAPTVFRAAVERDFPRDVTLIDSNGYIGGPQFTGGGRQVMTADIIKDEIPSLSGKVVITDPPWYEEYSRAFLWAVARVTACGGTVLLSAAPVGTRPSIEEEWVRTKSFASAVGLEFVSSEQVLRYRMPPFERNALRAAGHIDVEYDWRPGVLWTFLRTSANPAAERPFVCTNKNEWDERSMSGVRFRIRRRFGSRGGDPRLVTLVAGDILNSVSRRDPRRSTVDVWTSGNRVFGCAAPDSFVTILDAISTTTLAADAVERSLGRLLTDEERHHIAAAEDRVIEIVQREIEEYVNDWEG